MIFSQRDQSCFIWSRDRDCVCFVRDDDVDNVVIWLPRETVAIFQPLYAILCRWKYIKPGKQRNQKELLVEIQCRDVAIWR